MKDIARYTVVVLVTLSALFVLWQLRQAVALFLFSLAVTATFRPLVAYLADKNFPRGIALLIPYALVILVIMALIFLIGGPLIRDLEQASNQFASGYEQVLGSWSLNGTAFQRSLVKALPRPQDLFDGMTGEQAAWMVHAALGATINILSFAENLALTLILSLYWSADSAHFERLLLSLVPVEQRTRARLIWQGIEKGVGAYIRSELTQGFLAGILLWVGYRLMGLEYPLLLSFLGALAWLIPWFGAVIAVILPFQVGAASGLTLGLMAAFYTLAVLFMQEFFIEPRIFKRQNYNLVVLVLVVLALVDVWGLPGLILAPLVSAALQIFFKHLVQSPVEAASARLSNKAADRGMEALHLRLVETRTEMENWEDPASPEISNLMERLDHLITETQHYLN